MTPSGTSLSRPSRARFWATTMLRTSLCTFKRMLGDESFRATKEGVWVNHEDVNPATGEVEDKHFWLVEHDGLVFGSGWHHDESGG